MSKELTRPGGPVRVTQYCGRTRDDGSDPRMVSVTDHQTLTTVHMRYAHFVDMLAQVLPDMLEEALDATTRNHR
jgi:hypothetical protein